MRMTSLALAINGMMQYYGVISLVDLLVLCNRYELCRLNDYKAVLHCIQTNLEQEQKVFLHKKMVCHKAVYNPFFIRDMQSGMVAGEYKEFPLNTYFTVGKKGIVETQELRTLRCFLRENAMLCDRQLSLEVNRLWVEMNNMTELVVLGSQCIKNLELPWAPDTPAYRQFLEKIRLVSDNMPRWSCKGFSYAEIRCLERLGR